MTVEMRYLAWAVVLGLVHVTATGLAGLVNHGTRYSMGPRDEPAPDSRLVGRIKRSFANYMETFPFFAAAVLVAQVSGRHGSLTTIGAALYFWSRLAYVPLYVAGIPIVRTLVYEAAALGIVLVLIGLT